MVLEIITSLFIAMFYAESEVKSHLSRGLPRAVRKLRKGSSRQIMPARRPVCWSKVPRMAERPKVVLTIAGFDPSSGAGITADIKTIAAHGCYGVACITALTVQSTAGVRRIEPVASQLFLETLHELIADIGVAAVH